jgi:hypothetical protein
MAKTFDGEQSNRTGRTTEQLLTDTFTLVGLDIALILYPYIRVQVVLSIVLIFVIFVVVIVVIVVVV